MTLKDKYFKKLRLAVIREDKRQALERFTIDDALSAEHGATVKLWFSIYDEEYKSIANDQEL